MKNRILTRIIILVVLLLILAAGAFFFLVDRPFNPNDENENGYMIEIPMGSSTGDIAEILEANGIIDSAFKYKLFSKINKYDGKYVAGNYSLSPKMTKKEICEILVSGKTNDTTFTIPEGYTIDDIIKSLSEQGYINAQEFIYAMETGDFSKYDFLNYTEDTKYKLEGYLFPATYTLPTEGENSVEYNIMTSMLDAFDNMLTDEYKARAEELGYSIHQILTIASIIEKEAITDEDRALVASVIYNRLDTGMTLGMDTTILYVLEEHKVDITYGDMEVESPYNTYKYPGLPPGPICNPGESAIRAALYPAESNYYYFVLSDKLDGSVKFSETFEEFEVDVEKYYSARDAAESNG